MTATNEAPAPLGLIEQLTCVVVDTETTGFNVDEGHRLIEIATVDVEAGILRGPGWSSLVNPGRDIPEGATRVHGITGEMVATAPPPTEVGFGLRARLGDEVLCFHNAPFDLPFVQQFFAEAGTYPVTGVVIDSLGIARGLFGMGKNDLATLTAKLQLEPETAHRALGDARMTARALVALARIAEHEKGIRTVVDLAAWSQDVMSQTSFRRGRR